MNTYNAYVTFVDKNGEKIKVSVAEIINSGIPIDSDNGDDLELFDSEIVEY